MDRRRFLAASASTILGASVAAAQDAIILRPDIDGAHPRYVAYATVGPFIYPERPLVVTGLLGRRMVVFASQMSKNPRLIVFSHTALADPVTYSNLLWHWVSHGYIVVAPLHDDSIIEDGPTIRVNTPGETSKWPIAELLEDRGAWEGRCDACKSVLDVIGLIEDAVGGIKINVERPVIVGHGYGAYVAQLILGTRVVTADSGVDDMSSTRFFSGIFMSPQGEGVMGLTAESWASVSAPHLSIIAEHDNDFTGQPPTAKTAAFYKSQPGYKHMGILRGGGSGIYSGQLSGIGQKNQKRVEA
ncbi:hypothetical protein, partial [Roseibium sp. RKSG952]|uniref:poly(ethylene terephthalate) hydrolase family protein n=1 Tax=Roseibium sp. RKSG952 TaxID=2529384 RepID=UPI0012BD28C4